MSLLCQPNIACQLIRDKNPLWTNDQIIDLYTKILTEQANCLNKKFNIDTFTYKNITQSFDDFRKYYKKVTKKTF